MGLLYESTNRKAPKVTFKEALIRGLAPDRGLYLPTEIPRFESDDFSRFKKSTYHDVAAAVCWKFLDEVIPSKALAEITRQAYDFDVPLERVYGRAHVMRLDRGPTASFKDFAARLMAALMQFFLREEGRKLTILTATSGDTGSAVASAFHGLDNIRVVVLYPEGEVTDTQRRQMTTLRGNIFALAVDGKFDDCQALVKRAFSDDELSSLNLSSANSINFGRLLPQSVYYVYAYSKLFIEPGEKAVFSVPSGNFGDLMGGLIAMRMGLPVGRFIAATNENDEFPNYLNSGAYKPITPSKACISNAMNVGHPSNLARLIHLYGGWMNERGEVLEAADMVSMRRDIWSVSVSDVDTRKAISEAYSKYNLLLEPHGAVGWCALTRYLGVDEATLAISLETADPAKFPEEIVSTLGFKPKIPVSLRGLDKKIEEFTRLQNDYGRLKGFLLSL